MIDPVLRRPGTWRPFLTGLRDAGRAVEFRGTIFPGSYGGSVEGGGNPGVMDPLDELSDLVDGAGVAVRAVVTAAGDGRVDLVAGGPQVTFGMGHEVLETVLLADGADPEPYRRAPAHHDVPVSPGADPDAVRVIVRRALPDAAPALDPGDALPADVRALYLTAGSGDLILPEDDAAFHGIRIIPLDDAASREYLQPRMRYGSWAYGATEVVPPDPAGRVQPLAASPAWFAVGDDFGGNLLVADLAPGPNGHVGQILYVDHETSGGARWLAPSLTELLTARPTRLAPAGSEDGLLVRVGPRGGTLADVRPETEVVIAGAAPVDLAALAGHRAVRTLVADARATVTNLDQAGTLPALEYLQLGIPDWQRLLGANRVPETLRAAGFSGRGDWAATVGVAGTLLARWERPPLDRVEVRLALGGS